MGTLDPAWRNAIAAALLAAAAVGVAYLRGSPPPTAPGSADEVGVVERTVAVRLRRVEAAGASRRVVEIALDGDVVGVTTDPQVWDRLRRVLESEAASARTGAPGGVVLAARVTTSLARRVPPDDLARLKTLLRATGFERISYAPLGDVARPAVSAPGPRTLVPVELARGPDSSLGVTVDGLRAGTDADEGTWSQVGRLARAARQQRERESAGGARVVFEIRGGEGVTTRDLADAAEALRAAGISDVLYAER